MADRYLELVSSPLGHRVASRLGLPQPAELRRHTAGDPLLPGPIALGRLAGGGLDGLAELLVAAGTELQDPDSTTPDPAALIFDATELTTVADLAQLRDFMAARLRRLRPSGRVVILGRVPSGADPLVDACRQTLDGLVRSLAKEVRASATANLVLLDGGGADAQALESVLLFLLSGRSAYVDGQVIRVGVGGAAAGSDDGDRVVDWAAPLSGKVAVVTGAARGIGAAIAGVLARDGAQVVVADLPSAGEALANVANRIGATTLQLDITAPDAAKQLVAHAQTRFGGLDVVVHNAGITRDRLLANMKPEHWDSVLAVNLQAQLAVNAALLADGALRAEGRVICLASTSGIAGNRGQTNYAASKAGVIGMVRSFAPSFAEHGWTINAVAPGFIDTDMTHSMPLATREVARRINSLQQAGLPVDVAEAVGWLAWPTSGGVNGAVLRVCGQNLVGA
ncbi:3-oxoacyl-ACP reductase [soil metagenome]